MSFATLTAGATTSNVLDASVSLPRWGVWSALVRLDRGDTELSGSCVLVLGALVLVGTIRRGTTYVGRGLYEIAGGANGWGTTIPANSYRGPQTLLSTLAKESAGLVGETIAVEAGGDLVVGAYVRFAGPASRVLNQYRPGQWWVEIDGTTHIGDRTPLPAPSVRVLDYHAELGIVDMSDDSAIVLPGQLFASGGVSGSVSTVRHELKGGRLRTAVHLQ